MLKPAVFLDRDSTLNQRVYDERRHAHVSPLQVERVSLRRDAVAFVRGLNRMGYLCLVLTEQPELATGRLTVVRLDRINQKLREDLARNGVHLDGIFLRGFDSGGGPAQPLQKQPSRKQPAQSLLIEAASVHHVDLRRSFVVSDRLADIASGRAAGVATILLRRSVEGPAKPDEAPELRPDHIAENLLVALRIIESTREAFLR